MQKTNLAEKLTHIREYWSPHIVGALNGQHVKLAKLHGEFDWHHHEHEDELFLVVKGRLRMELKSSDITLEEGEFLIVRPRVEHRPVADEVCHVLLFEPAGTLNTGNLVNDRTVPDPKSI